MAARMLSVRVSLGSVASQRKAITGDRVTQPAHCVTVCVPGLRVCLEQRMIDVAQVMKAGTLPEASVRQRSVTARTLALEAILD